MDTARFAKVVAECGRPEVYTLWLGPDADSIFQKALKQQRIMTIRQEAETGTADYGEVGYTGARGELLLFPQTLKGYGGKRIVGIKYDLLRRSEPAEEESRATIPSEKRRSKNGAKPKAARTEAEPAVTVDVPEPERETWRAPQSMPDRERVTPSATKAPMKEKKEPSIRSNIVPFVHDSEQARSPTKSGTKRTTGSKRQKQRRLPQEEPAASAAKPKGEPEKPTPLAEAPTPHDLVKRAMAELKDGKAVQAYATLVDLEQLLRLAGQK